MAQLTTESEILAQPLGTTLCTINPFGCGYKIQHKVNLKEMTIDKIVQLELGATVVCSVELDNSQSHSPLKVEYEYINILLSHPKFVFNNREEALAKLGEVHQGLCVDAVREHHEYCKSMFY